MDMKLRHAAVLALTGWYLIVPRDLPTEKDSLPPLFQWTVQRTFSTKVQCEHELDKGLASLKAAQEAATAEAQRANEKRTDGMQIESLVGSVIQYGKCVTTHDPRLKEK
jgi:hypothetical protein